jgi:hypothetical protein
MEKPKLKNHIVTEKPMRVLELIRFLLNDESIYWRHRILPTAFFMNWSVSQLRSQLELFYRIKKKEQI